ncbi:MAG: amidohydrolase [Gemmatimonadetes bacterium]|jgi:predicted TIM-barrel fold metal-dependent hydrolase|nr:amidohydrolase [Gemmatimonadota bacterium]MBT4613260.1 amidohydrolase [Gemmatimonadota bacterium]MBT5060193.1 amidohydrolase [Gemmatimonadota bacterium]MBT5146462.1 amidohydrolase [Gemmatimonadota bacterium]MBT5591383.1 amidohydrolase [Gemmatimonadota bacterium]
MSDVQIVDAHIHAWSPDIERFPLAPGFESSDLWLPSFTPDDHDMYTSLFGEPVAGINLVQMTWYGLDHRYILDLIESDPHRFTGTGIVPAVSDVSLGSPERIMRDLARNGIRAFRIRGRAAQPQWGQTDQWLDQDGYERMFAAAAEDDLVLSFLVGPTDLPEIGRMCSRFPETAVIIDHVGGVRVQEGAIDATQLQALLDLAAHPRVFVKLGPIPGLGDAEAPFSGSVPLLRPVIDTFGADRCMWETDSGGPLLFADPPRDLLAAVDVIRRAEFLTDHDKRLILGGTARQLLWAS